jgi:hypothetical protein
MLAGLKIVLDFWSSVLAAMAVLEFFTTLEGEFWMWTETPQKGTPATDS